MKYNYQPKTIFSSLILSLGLTTMSSANNTDGCGEFRFPNGVSARNVGVEIQRLESRNAEIRGLNTISLERIQSIDKFQSLQRMGRQKHAGQYPKIEPSESLLITKKSVVEQFSYAEILNSLARSVNYGQDQATVEKLAKSIDKNLWQTFAAWDGSSDGSNAEYIHCGIKATDSQVGISRQINGFVYTCPRNERLLGSQFDLYGDGRPSPEMKVLAIVNRPDLWEQNVTCGEFRIVSQVKFKNDRALLSFEADLAHTKEDGQCSAIQNFWSRLTGADDESKVSQLKQFFFEGVNLEDNGEVSQSQDSAYQIEPIMHIRNLGFSDRSDELASGQLRINSNWDSDWLLREYEFRRLPNGVVTFLPVSLGGTPDPTLFRPTKNDQEIESEDSQRLKSWIKQVKTHAKTFKNHIYSKNQATYITHTEPPTINEVLFEDYTPIQPDKCSEAAEINTDNQYAGNVSASQPLDQQIAGLDFDQPEGSFKLIVNEMAGFGDADKKQIVNRIGFTSCGGCHRFTVTDSLAGTRGLEFLNPFGGAMRWKRNEFTHIKDTLKNDGTPNSAYYEISDALTNIFLPRREIRMRALIGQTPQSCQELSLSSQKALGCN